MYKKKILLRSILALALTSSIAHAAVSPGEAQRLKADLMPLGGELKGNGKDIPDWTGGLTEKPAEYKRPGQHHPDPFKDDQVLFNINAQNMEQYKGHLTPGVQALLQAYPTTFRIPVYQTRRTSSAPEWVYENTFKNATRAELVRGGNGIENAYGGVPFPILSGNSETKALQAIWNHLTRWRGIFLTRRSSEAAVQRNGEYQLVTSQQEIFFNYSNPEGSYETLNNILFYYLSFTISPPRLAGGAVLIHETLDQVREPRKAWGYSSGQRRVRAAPNLAYDSPIAASDNLRTADDTDMFTGAPDRYNWKYLGKKEIYVPYNNYQIAADGVKYRDVLGVSHINPDLTRFEKHRVHVVEATLKPGARHIYAKRVFYIDEDSWSILLVDQHDDRGELWRVSMAFTKNYYELPGIGPSLDVFYDLQARRYHVQGLMSEERTTYIFSNDIPNERYFRPQELRRRGTR